MMVNWTAGLGRSVAGAAVAAGMAGIIACAAPAAADAVDGTVNPASAIRAVIRQQLTFPGLGKANAKTFMVTQWGYTRTFNASSTSCGDGDRAIVRFTPAATAGPTATFTVTPVSAGSCTITVANDGSGSVRVPVVVLPARP